MLQVCVPNPPASVVGKPRIIASDIHRRAVPAPLYVVTPDSSGTVRQATVRDGAGLPCVSDGSWYVMGWKQWGQFGQADDGLYQIVPLEFVSPDGQAIERMTFGWRQTAVLTGM